ncbi:schlafen-like protein 1 [Mytilus trossulus]|uniref:schlafen-like protein 1 n=1 Tax=Mytilus trossulus TaxID=6551 RepID=UPI003005CB13
MGDQSKKDENAVFIGNLKKDASKDELKNYLFELLKHHLKISLNLHNIEVKGGKKNRAKFAFIHLNSKIDRDKTIYMLDSRESQSRVGFDFSHLVDPNYQIIKVGVKKPVVDEKAGIKPKSKQEKIEKFKSSDMKTKLPDTPSQHIQQINVSAQHIHGNSVSGGGVLKSAIDNHDNGGNAITKYYEDQLLGNETRDKEFKLGGGELTLTLKQHVSKYLCGFLNSSQKGTLFIGVKDSGEVKGIECDQPTEDKIRLRIDETVKTFKPALFPQKYHVDFVPVYMKDGTLKNNFKVLQITVEKVDNLTQLYQADGKVYMRRDGSVEVLDPSYIQDWCKQIHHQELQKQQEENVRSLDLERNKILSEKEKEKKQIQEKKEEEMSKLKKQMTEIKEEEISKLKKKITVVEEENKYLKKNKSKVCVLM